MWNRIYVHENKICKLDILNDKWSPLFIHIGFEQDTDFDYWFLIVRGLY